MNSSVLWQQLATCLPLQSFAGICLISRAFCICLMLFAPPIEQQYHANPCNSMQYRCWRVPWQHQSYPGASSSSSSTQTVSTCSLQSAMSDELLGLSRLGMGHQNDSKGALDSSDLVPSDIRPSFPALFRLGHSRWKIDRATWLDLF